MDDQKAGKNFTATILNNSNKTLNLAYFCKGEKNNPSGTGTEKNKLYHGEMVAFPTQQIAPNGQGSFAAKSTGSSVQGTVVYSVEGSSDIWMYFKVKSSLNEHIESENVRITVLDNSKHSIVTYTMDSNS